MITNSGSTAIAVPVEAVFDFLADARNEPRWLPGASDVRLTSPEPVGRGSTFAGEYARAGTVTVEIARYDRPGRLTLAGDAKTLSFVDEIELTATDGGTLLTATMTTTPKGLLRLAAPMMRRVIGKQFQGNWDSLEAALESGAS